MSVTHSGHIIGRTSLVLLKLPAVGNTFSSVVCAEIVFGFLTLRHCGSIPPIRRESAQWRFRLDGSCSGDVNATASSVLPHWTSQSPRIAVLSVCGFATFSTTQI